MFELSVSGISVENSEIVRGKVTVTCLPVGSYCFLPICLDLAFDPKIEFPTSFPQPDMISCTPARVGAKA